MPLTLQLAFAGAWAYILHWGIGVALIIILVTCAVLTTSIPLIGPYLKDLRAQLLWAAFGVAVFLAGHAVGAKDAANRYAKQQVIVEKTVDKAVEKTSTPTAKKQKDRWDRSEY